MSRPRAIPQPAAANTAANVAADERAIRVIRRARELLGDTQKRFARRLGVHPVTVARWETGKRVPAIADKDRVTDIVASAMAAQIGLREVTRGGGHSDPAHVWNRAFLLSQAIILQQAAAFTLEEWSLCLAMDLPTLRRLVPKARRIRSVDIGFALEAANRGAKATDLASTGSEKTVAAAIHHRLTTELRLQLALLQRGTEIVPGSWKTRRPSTSTTRAGLQKRGSGR